MPTASKLDWADYIAAIFLGLGLGVRMVISAPNVHFNALAGEGSRVALAFAQQGTLADAYFDGQGPTAHLMPVMPVIAGTIYRLFGDSAPVVLLSWAMFQVAAAYALTYLAFRELGFPKVSRLLAMLLLSIPIFSQAEIDAFRFWEGALCACLVGLTILLMARKASPPILCAISAFSTLANPIVGLALFACIGAYSWPLGQFRRATLIGGALTTLLLAPWIVRNQVQIGHPVVRSNFWTEVRLAYNSDALSSTDPQRDYLARMAEVHPYKSKAAQQQIREIGEVGYNVKMKAEALAWIEDHPRESAELALHHLRDFFFPPAWAYDFWEKERIRSLAVIVMPTLNFLGLAWLLIGAVQRRPLFLPILAYVSCVALPYILVQPLPRYAYVIYPIMVFLAAEMLVSPFGWLRPGQRGLR